MLNKASELIGSSIAATDGEIGGVSDLMFDDQHWTVRWLVVDTGTWLPGRKVLLPSSQLGGVLPGARAIRVELTRDQVRSSPDIDTQRPVSRQMEALMYDHYGSSPYWPAGTGLGAPMAGYPGYMPPPDYVAAAPARVEERVGYQPRRSGDPHLRSAKEVTGYNVQGSDNEVGHVEDFLIDPDGWAVRYLIVDTRNWWPGKNVLIAPSWVESIEWGAHTLHMRHTRNEIKNAPEYDPTLEIERDYESKLHRYYGRSEYWQ